MNSESENHKPIANELMQEVRDDLRAIAATYLRNERQGHTLEPTALVHEAWMKLAVQKKSQWKDSTHFRAVAAIVMRRILVDHARAHNAQKRGGDHSQVTLSGIGDSKITQPIDALQLDEALQKLAQMSDRQAKIVELRFFGGLTNDQVAEYLGITIRTIQREWITAKAWLFAELSDI